MLLPHTLSGHDAHNSAGCVSAMGHAPISYTHMQTYTSKRREEETGFSPATTKVCPRRSHLPSICAHPLCDAQLHAWLSSCVIDHTAKTGESRCTLDEMHQVHDREQHLFLLNRFAQPKVFQDVVLNDYLFNASASKIGPELWLFNAWQKDVTKKIKTSQFFSVGLSSHLIGFIRQGAERRAELFEFVLFQLDFAEIDQNILLNFWKHWCKVDARVP